MLFAFSTETTSRRATDYLAIMSTQQSTACNSNESLPLISGTIHTQDDQEETPSPREHEHPDPSGTPSERDETPRTQEVFDTPETKPDQLDQPLGQFLTLYEVETMKEADLNRYTRATTCWLNPNHKKNAVRVGCEYDKTGKVVGFKCNGSASTVHKCIYTQEMMAKQWIAFKPKAKKDQTPEDDAVTDNTNATPTRPTRTTRAPAKLTHQAKPKTASANVRQFRAEADNSVITEELLTDASPRSAETSEPILPDEEENVQRRPLVLMPHVQHTEEEALTIQNLLIQNQNYQRIITEYQQDKKAQQMLLEQTALQDADTVSRPGLTTTHPKMTRPTPVRPTIDPDTSGLSKSARQRRRRRELSVQEESTPYPPTKSGATGRASTEHPKRAHHHDARGRRDRDRYQPPRTRSRSPPRARYGNYRNSRRPYSGEHPMHPPPRPQESIYMPMLMPPHLAPGMSAVPGAPTTPAPHMALTQAHATGYSQVPQAGFPHAGQQVYATAPPLPYGYPTVGQPPWADFYKGAPGPSYWKQGP